MMDLDNLENSLEEHFGFNEFRTNQREIISALLNKKDVLALMPTGGGKSICYQLPAILLEGTAVVVSPLISLMQNQVNGLRAKGINAESLNSTLSTDEFNAILNKVREGEVDLLYLSPEKLNTAFMWNFLAEVNVSFFAIDEAHCVSQWGHDFRSDYLSMGKIKENFRDTLVMALTATADEIVQEDIVRQLDLVDCQKFVSSFNRSNIYYMAQAKNSVNKQVLGTVKKHGDENGIVYCPTVKKVEGLYSILNQAVDKKVIMYHGRMDSQARERALEIFENEENVLVIATIAFGMGIDKPNIRYVIHAGMAKNIESFYQESGRAGRDGDKSYSYLFFGLDDLVTYNRFIELSNMNEDFKQLSEKKLREMFKFCETYECRTKVLVNYFGEQFDKDCGHCDSCLEDYETVDATLNAKKFLSTVFRTKQKFATGHCIKVLRGLTNDRIKMFGHDQLSVFGIGADTDETTWSDTVNRLISLGHLRIVGEYRSLHLTEKAQDIFSDREIVKIKANQNSRKKAPRRAKTSKGDLSGEDEILYNALREYRTAQSTENQVAPYQVFTNRALEEIVEFRPKSLDELLEVNGIGQKKCDSYGDAILNIVKFNDSRA